MHSLPNITQRVERVEEDDKRGYLRPVLDGLAADCRALVFVSATRVTGTGGAIDILAGPLDEWLRKGNIRLIGIHEGCTQQECEFGLQLFNAGERHIIIATHASTHELNFSREADIVILYDMPNSIKEYVECVRRTKKTGLAIVYFNHSNAGIARELIQLLKFNKQPVPHWLDSIASTAN